MIDSCTFKEAFKSKLKESKYILKKYNNISKVNFRNDVKSGNNGTINLINNDFQQEENVIRCNTNMDSLNMV